MSIPGFNADATLYKTSRRYQTSRNMINVPTQMIYPAEVIEVHGCPPGFNLWEAGGDWGCDPEGPSGEVGGDGGGQPPGGQPPGGGGGGSGTPPKPTPKPKPPANTNCECSPGCGQASGDPCRWIDVPGSSVQACTGTCNNSEGRPCGACEEVKVPPKEVPNVPSRTRVAETLFRSRS